ncbi:MAG: IS3 family transposase, partial [Planctomycetota bacterium]
VAFVKRYNEEWLIEKMGFRSPTQARREYALAEAA